MDNSRFSLSFPTENASPQLLKDLTFFISRECPFPVMAFMILSMGGSIVEEEADATHVIAERTGKHL